MSSMTDHSTARALLEKAAAQFRYYEECHRNKVTHSVTTEADRVAIEKAEVNAALAQEIEDFIEQSLTPPEGDTVSEGVVERVARAIYEQHGKQTPWSAVHNQHKALWRNDARAALAALQSRVSPQEGQGDLCAAIYRAMRATRD